MSFLPGGAHLSSGLILLSEQTVIPLQFHAGSLGLLWDVLGLLFLLEGNSVLRICVLGGCDILYSEYLNYGRYCGC